mmetsp:Transcript_9648/g.13286  ORF Transcript_9648/g.13286 Transcript_9648/m.13286 type:complete len:192 (+) Transcript_9648:12-587(+)
MEYGIEEEHRPTPFFSSKEDIEKKKGRRALSRFKYLQALITEFQDTSDDIAKQQILSHLANFAYDPVNYDWFRQLHIIDLFMDVLDDETCTKCQEFAVAGICNLCIDPQNAKLILMNGNVGIIMKTLSSNAEETVLSGITTLFYLLSPLTKNTICTKSVLQCVEKYKSSNNIRLKNLATIFLQESEKLMLV